MKTKAKAKVYYFEHHNGVLKNNTGARYRMLAGLMSAMLVFGGIGLAVSKYAKANHERETAQTSIALIKPASIR